MNDRIGAGYYVHTLAGARLMECYEVAPERVRRYLRAEIDFALEHVHPSDRVLELGTGYGRVLSSMADRVSVLVGIDTSEESLVYGSSLQDTRPTIQFLAMDALRLGFADGRFDVTLCLQNGLSAFKIDRQALMREAIRVTRPGGVALFSTYAGGFWNDRLAWFEAQAKHGLIGPLDYDLTGDGTIVCGDGFRATTISPEEFEQLCRCLDVSFELREIDGSSLFCVVRKPLRGMSHRGS